MDGQTDRKTNPYKNVTFGNAPHHYNGAKNSDTKQYSFLVYEYRNRNGEMIEVTVRMRWCPDGLSVHLPLLSFPAP